MKTLIAIPLLFLFLSASSEFYQLVKLPVLVQHYAEHQEDEPYKSLADFLFDHYSSNSSHNDKHDHNNLPFKSQDCTTVHLQPVFNVEMGQIISSPKWVMDNSTPSLYVDFYSFDALSKIWEPPQIS